MVSPTAGRPQNADTPLFTPPLLDQWIGEYHVLICLEHRRLAAAEPIQRVGWMCRHSEPSSNGSRLTPIAALRLWPPTRVTTRHHLSAHSFEQWSASERQSSPPPVSDRDEKPPATIRSHFPPCPVRSVRIVWTKDAGAAARPSPFTSSSSVRNSFQSD